MSAIDICPDCMDEAQDHGPDGCTRRLSRMAAGMFGRDHCNCPYTSLEVEQMVELATLRRLLLECWSLTRDDAAPSAELRAMVEALKGESQP